MDGKKKCCGATRRKRIAQIEYAKNTQLVEDLQNLNPPINTIKIQLFCEGLIIEVI